MQKYVSFVLMGNQLQIISIKSKPNIFGWNLWILQCQVQHVNAHHRNGAANDTIFSTLWKRQENNTIRQMKNWFQTKHLLCALLIFFDFWLAATAAAWQVSWFYFFVFLFNFIITICQAYELRHGFKRGRWSDKCDEGRKNNFLAYGGRRQSHVFFAGLQCRFNSSTLDTKNTKKIKLITQHAMMQTWQKQNRNFIKY